MRGRVIPRLPTGGCPCVPPSQLRHVLKLSPEKWEEVCQHALSAVVPDFRNRVWWCTPLRLGLLYQCKNGAIIMDNPMGEQPAALTKLRRILCGRNM